MYLSQFPWLNLHHGSNGPITQQTNKIMERLKHRPRVHSRKTVHKARWQFPVFTVILYILKRDPQCWADFKQFIFTDGLCIWPTLSILQASKKNHEKRKKTSTVLWNRSAISTKTWAIISTDNLLPCQMLDYMSNTDPSENIFLSGISEEPHLVINIREKFWSTTDYFLLRRKITGVNRQPNCLPNFSIYINWFAYTHFLI